MNDENNKQNAVETNQAPPTPPQDPTEPDKPETALSDTEMTEPEAPVQETTDTEAPVQETTDTEATAQETPEPEATAQETTDPEASAQETTDTDAPIQEASDTAAPETEKPAPETPETDTSAQASQHPVKIKRRQHYYTNLPDVGLEAMALKAPWQENPDEEDDADDGYDYPDGYKPESTGKVAMAIAVSAAAVVAVAVMAFLAYIILNADIFKTPTVATADSAPASTAYIEPTTETATDRTVIMPDLSGLKESEAYKLLNDAEVRYKVIRVTSEDIPFNYIVSQNPPAYDTLPHSKVATIYVSKGRENEIIHATTRPPATTPKTTQPTTVAGTNTPSNQDYLLPDSASKELNRNDLAPFDRDTLNLALNEIFARHGRKFSDPDINAYFRSKSWYRPTVSAKDFDMSILNRYENYNINLITNYQSEMGYR
ncbi:MAG: YARHG domain-containing protein [Ruminococcus sp.]|nr:YARHG domain-containing protein [Ruminococcus sp.]